MAPSPAPYSGLSNFGLAMSAGGAVTSAIGSFFAILDTQNQLKSQALSLEFQQSMSALNARAAERDADAVMEAGRREIALMGVAYAQEKSMQRTSTAGAGVRVGTGSSAEVLASTELAKRLNAFQMNIDTVARAHSARAEAVGHRNQGLLAGVSARNLRRSARNMSPAAGAVTSLLSSAGSVASQWAADARADLFYRSRF